MKAVLVGIVFCGLIAGSGYAEAQGDFLPQNVYKWVDDEGVTHYSDQPPLGVPSERTTVRVRTTNQPSSQTRLDEQRAMSEATATRRQQEKEDAAERQDVEKANRKIREQNCQQARERQKTYNEARRIYRELDSGDREYLTSEQIDAERAAANQQVQEWCG